MRAVTGAIVVLAGSVLAGASVLAQELVPAIGNRWASTPSIWAGLGGMTLIIVGLALLVAGMQADSRPPSSSAPPPITDRPAQ
jgi:protein-S-isoprenylcysteine O-methyltransferase Ste14